MKKKIKLKCKLCNLIFEVKPSRLKKAKFCSLKCYNIYRHKPLEGKTAKEIKKIYRSKEYQKNKNKYLLKAKEWREKNKEYCLKYGKKWREENKSKKFLSDKRWRIKNKEKIKEYQKRRRVKKLGASGSHTEKEWNELKKRHKYTCVSCNRKEPKIKLTEDHIVPITKEGSDYISNIQPLCRSCNSRKYQTIIRYMNNRFKPLEKLLRKTAIKSQGKPYFIELFNDNEPLILLKKDLFKKIINKSL